MFGLLASLHLDYLLVSHHFMLKINKQLDFKIDEGKYAIPKHWEISLKLLSIIHRCLQYDHKKRITHKELVNLIDSTNEFESKNEIMLKPTLRFLESVDYPKEALVVRLYFQNLNES